MKTRVLITGGTGLLGTHLLLSAPKSVEVFATVHDYQTVLDLPGVNYFSLDIKNKKQVEKKVSQLKPDVIIHTAAHGRVDFCENNKQEAYDTNLVGTINLVDAAQKHHAKVIFCSTNMTFDGLNPLYDEKSDQKPDTYYGQLKVQAEEYIKSSGVVYTIVRLMTMYGWNFQPERQNMVSMLLTKLKNKQPLWMTNDVFNNMLYVKQAANFFWQVIDNPQKSDQQIIHIAGVECINRYQVTRIACQVFGLDQSLVTEVDSSYFSGTETPRSPNTCFDTTKAVKLLEFAPLTIKKGLQDMKTHHLPTKTKIYDQA